MNFRVVQFSFEWMSCSVLTAIQMQGGSLAACFRQNDNNNHDTAVYVSVRRLWLIPPQNIVVAFNKMKTFIHRNNNVGFKAEEIQVAILTVYLS